MTRTERTATGPAHDVPPLFEVDSSGDLLPDAATSILSLIRAVERAAEACQAVAATCRRRESVTDPARVVSHFLHVRDVCAAHMHKLEAYAFENAARRPTPASSAALLAFVQDQLDYYREHSAVAPLGRWGSL